MSGDSKASGFSRAVQKHSLRVRERFLQNLGKKDRTTDQLFEIHQNNFSKQQLDAMRLQKELKKYATCAREMQAASKALMDCMAEIYEPDWPEHDTIPHKATAIELLWGNLCHKINDQCTIPLSTYLSQFSEIRNKMEKRSRKLLDYDAARHSLEAIQAASKKRDDIKLAKAHEQMEEARRLYQVLNKELLEELPALYDSRIPFYILTFQTLFTAETHFHQEYAKVDQQLAEMIEALAMVAAQGTYQSANTERLLAEAQQQSQQQNDSSAGLDTSNASAAIAINNKMVTSESDSFGSPSPTSSALPGAPVSPVKLSAGESSKPGSPAAGSNHISADDGNYLKHNDTNQIHSNTNGNEKKPGDELYEIPIGATTKDLPPGVIYKVKATYKYVAEDKDELSFDPGEILHVVQYEDPDEQEEGWLMGIRELTGEKGLFPANFTRPI